MSKNNSVESRNPKSIFFGTEGVHVIDLIMHLLTKHEKIKMSLSLLVK